MGMTNKDQRLPSRGSPLPVSPQTMWAKLSEAPPVGLRWAWLPSSTSPTTQYPHPWGLKKPRRAGLGESILPGREEAHTVGVVSGVALTQAVQDNLLQCKPVGRVQLRFRGQTASDFGSATYWLDELG